MRIEGGGRGGAIAVIATLICILRFSSHFVVNTTGASDQYDM